MIRLSFIIALCCTYTWSAQAQSVTPRACAVTAITTGGTAVTVLTGPANGYYVFNPLSATDQGIVSAEALYIDPTQTAVTTGSGTNASLAPGQVFYGIGSSSLGVSVNAATSSHAFTCVRW